MGRPRLRSSNFNSHGSRRDNHNVMIRGTIADIWLRNTTRQGWPWPRSVPGPRSVDEHPGAVTRGGLVVDPTHPVQPPPLTYNDRLERAIAVPWHLDLHRPQLGQHRLGPAAVTGVGAV
jgi:hypothetical protein